MVSRRSFASSGRSAAFFLCARWNGSFVKSRLVYHVPLSSSFSIGLARLPCCNRRASPCSAVVLRACRCRWSALCAVLGGWGRGAF